MSEHTSGTNQLEIKQDEIYEVVRIKKTRNECSYCESYSQQNQNKQVAIVSCEGACLRGEISRRAANLISFNLAPEKTVRICLGGAFTKDTGQRNLVRNADRVIVIEGCFIQCASRMMQGVLPNFKHNVVVADTLYDLEGDFFAINEIEEEKIQDFSNIVAKNIIKELNL